MLPTFGRSCAEFGSSYTRKKLRSERAPLQLLGKLRHEVHDHVLVFWPLTYPSTAKPFLPFVVLAIVVKPLLCPSFIVYPHSE
jgi:hypothetical protein